MVEKTSDLSAELTAWIDGELPEARAREVEAAVAADPKLAALAQKLRRTIAAVEALPQTELATNGLRRNVLAAIETPTWGERLSAWLTPGRLAPAGLAVAGAVTAVVLARRSGGDEVGDDELLMAQHLDVVEDLDLVGAESPEDVDVIASLHELEVER